MPRGSCKLSARNHVLSLLLLRHTLRRRGLLRYAWPRGRSARLQDGPPTLERRRLAHPRHRYVHARTAHQLTPRCFVSTHSWHVWCAVGKWNLGHHLFPYTPTRRGFSTFFGYYAACQVGKLLFELGLLPPPDCYPRLPPVRSTTGITVHQRTSVGSTHQVIL